MENTLESTVVVSLRKDKEKEFERITTQLGKDLSNSASDSKGYDVWLTKDGNKGFIRQKSKDSKGMINYLDNVLKKNIPVLQGTGHVTHNYLFGTFDKDVIRSAEMVTGGSIKPTMYDRHIVSINGKYNR